MPLPMLSPVVKPKRIDKCPVCNSWMKRQNLRKYPAIYLCMACEHKKRNQENG